LNPRTDTHDYRRDQEDAHWNKIQHLKKSVGSGVNKALVAIEDANPDTLQDVLKTINFNRKVGQRTMDKAAHFHNK